MQDKIIIGRDTLVGIGDEITNVPAKIDTGADGSAIWASDIFVDESGILHFKLFGEDSPFYTGKEHTSADYSVALTKSTSGNIVMRYKVKLSVKIGGRRIRATFGLSNRATHNYPILIGRRTLNGKFIVDVSQKSDAIEKIERITPPHLNKQMKEDPYKFYKEQYLNGAND